MENDVSFKHRGGKRRIDKDVLTLLNGRNIRPWRLKGAETQPQH
jgi:hypothetical protein